MVSISGDMDATRRATLSNGRRRAVAKAPIVVIAVVDLDTSRGVVGVLVDGVLHLAEEIVDLDEILLGPGVGGHGQVVLLGQGVLGRCRPGVSNRGGLGHVVLGGCHGAARDGE